MAKEFDRDAQRGAVDDADAGARGVGLGPRGLVLRVRDDAMRLAFRTVDFA